MSCPSYNAILSQVWLPCKLLLRPDSVGTESELVKGGFCKGLPCSFARVLSIRSLYLLAKTTQARPSRCFSDGASSWATNQTEVLQSAAESDHSVRCACFFPWQRRSCRAPFSSLGVSFFCTLGVSHLVCAAHLPSSRLSFRRWEHCL